MEIINLGKEILLIIKNIANILITDKNNKNNKLFCKIEKNNIYSTYKKY